jgi:hypothetical protein
VSAERVPSDEQLLSTIRINGNAAVTAVIGFRLHCLGFIGMSTDRVRHRLHKLEQLGQVARVRSCYAQHICWKVL